MKHEKNIRAMIIGHFGAQNLGDDLMLASLLRVFAQYGISPTVLTKSKNIGDLPETHKDKVHLVLRGSIIRVAKEILTTDLLVLGGGTHFQDNFSGRRNLKSFKSMFMFLCIFLFARSVNVKILWIGVGIGPLRTTLAKTMIKACANLTEGITVRDKESQEELKNIGINFGTLSFDLAALLPEFKLQKHSGNRDSRVLGINYFSATTVVHQGSGGTSFRKSLADTLNYILQDNPDLKIKLIVFFELKDAGGDLQDILELYKGFKGDLQKRVEVVRYISCRATLSEIADCDYFLASRYHSTVCAGLFGRPMLVVPYDRKVADVAKQFGLSDTAYISEAQSITKTCLTDKITSMLRSPFEYLPKLQLTEARKMSEKNIEVIESALLKIRAKRRRKNS